MESLLPPNVRYVEDSYAETWPTATQYGSIQFGPVKEGSYVHLPLPLALSSLPIDKQWDELQKGDPISDVKSTLLTWHILLGKERAIINQRVKSEVISRVNAAIAEGLIRNAVRRDPQTGRPG